MGKISTGMHEEREDARPWPGCFEWFEDLCIRREIWKVRMMDGHSKAPREVDCRLHGTPRIFLIFPCFSASPDRHGAKALEWRC